MALLSFRGFCSLSYIFKSPDGIAQFHSSEHFADARSRCEKWYAWTSASCASLKICSLMLGDGIAQFHVSMVSERLPYSFQQAKKAYDTAYSQAVTHPSTNAAQSCLTSVIGRELVFSTWYGRRHIVSFQVSMQLFLKNEKAKRKIFLMALLSFDQLAGDVLV